MRKQKVQTVEADNERTRRYSAKEEEKLHKEHSNAFPCAWCNGPHRTHNHRRSSMSGHWQEMEAAAEAVTPQRAGESNGDHQTRVIQVIRQKYDETYQAAKKSGSGVNLPRGYNFAESERLFKERFIEKIFMLPRTIEANTQPLTEENTEPLIEENTVPLIH